MYTCTMYIYMYMYMYLFHEREEESDGLDCLPESHLVCKDCVSVLGPREPEPVDPLQLVAMESAVGEVGWLLAVLLCRL